MRCGWDGMELRVLKSFCSRRSGENTALTKKLAAGSSVK